MQAGITSAFAALCLCCTLSACGGGGGGGGAAAPPVTSPSTTSTPGGATNAILTLTAPSVGQSFRNRKPAYVPGTLQALSISVNGSAVSALQQFACSGTTAHTCSATFAVPSGSDSFVIELYGNSTQPLASATFTQTMPAGVTTALHPTFEGIVSSANLTLSNAYPPVGSSRTIQVGLHALDADGNYIDGDPLANPVTIALSGGNGHLSLGSNTFQNATDQLSLSYDGHFVQSAQLTITTQNVSGQPATIVPNVFQTFGPINSFVASVAVGANGAMWFVGCAQGNAGPCQPGVLANGTITQFTSVPDLASGALGPDGNMWFTGGSENPYIYRVTPSGTETPFLTHAIGPSEAYDSYAIVAGPDGNMWFTEGDRIGVITMSGSVQEYALNAYNRPQTLVVGPDGRLWFDNWQSVGAITTSGTITYYPIVSGEFFGSGVAFASDGNLHFFVQPAGGSGLRTMTTSGVETAVTTNQSGVNMAIVKGPDGNLWGPFPGGTILPANGGSLYPILASETPNGTTQYYYQVPNSNPSIGHSLVVAPDHSLWSGGNGQASVQGYLTRFIYNP